MRGWFLLSCRFAGGTDGRSKPGSTRRIIASKASNTPHDASGSEFHRGSVLLIVEGGSADIDDGAYGAIRLFLFEGGSEASGASVAMEAEASRRVDDRVPVREDKYWGCGEFREEGTNGILHCRGDIERGILFEKGRNRADVASHVGQELAVVTKTAK